MDQGSRFLVGKVLAEGTSQTVKAEVYQKFFEEHWQPYFGCPETLRFDAEGTWRSRELDDMFSKKNIYLDQIPGDAHWHISPLERSISWLKEFLSKQVEENPEQNTSSFVAAAIHAWNQREPVRGFSPVQHALGQAPDIDGRYFESEVQGLPIELMEQPEGAHAKQAELRISAEETFVRWQAKSRVDRALHSKGRNWPEYCPGDLVFFWRSYVKQKQDGKRIQTGSIGGYAGPARILALETRRDEDGKVKASSVVWLVRNNRLLKASIQQLRAASEREQLLFEMERPPDMPWTMTELARPLARTAYDDITQELPPSREMHSSDKIARYWVTPPGRRVRGKTEDPSFEKDDAVIPMEIQPSPTAGPSRARAPERASGSSAAAPPSSARPQKARSRSRPKPVDEEDDELYAHYGDIPECSYWQEEAAAVAIELELPTTRNGWKQMSKNPQTFLANMMKKKAVEVHERHMDLETKEKFRQAKLVEMNKFLKSEALEVLPQHLQPSKDQAMQMRWLLTWKVDGDGQTVPKARIVILGYQDPQYEHRVTYAPTTTRHTRQLMLQYAAGRQWWSWKGDVAAAFLQGRECKEDLYCIPTPELCELLQIPKESVSRLRKTCYGLVQAPYEWYETVREFLLSIGYTQLGSDPCCWILKVEDKVHAIICGHVDDFMFVADPKDPIWLESKKRIQDIFGGEKLKKTSSHNVEFKSPDKKTADTTSPKKDTWNMWKKSLCPKNVERTVRNPRRITRKPCCAGFWGPCHGIVVK